jgi:hypothetical protein
MWLFSESEIWIDAEDVIWIVTWIEDELKLKLGLWMKPKLLNVTFNLKPKSIENIWFINLLYTPKSDQLGSSGFGRC